MEALSDLILWPLLVIRLMLTGPWRVTLSEELLISRWPILELEFPVISRSSKTTVCLADPERSTLWLVKGRKLSDPDQWVDRCVKTKITTFLVNPLQINTLCFDNQNSLNNNVLKIFSVKHSMNSKNSYGGTSERNIKNMIRKYKKELKWNFLLL